MEISSLKANNLLNILLHKLLSEILTHTHTHTHIWTTNEKHYSFVYVSGFLGVLSPFSSTHCFICFALFCALPLWSSCDSAPPYGGAWPMSTIIPMMFTTSIKSGCNWNVLPRFPFPQQLLLPQRMHLPNMLTFGKSVAVAVYVSQSKAWHQQMHEAVKRKELRTVKTIANPPLVPYRDLGKIFLLEDWSS